MKVEVNKRSQKYLRALLSKPLTALWFGGVLVLIVASLIPQAGLSEIDSGFGKDKIARIIVFSLLAFYPVAFFPSIRMGLIVSTSMAPLGFLLELFQRYVPGRHFSPEDMIANNVGAIVGIFLALTIRFFFRTGHSERRVENKTPNTRFRAMEEDTVEALQDVGSHEEKLLSTFPSVAKTPKKSWKSKLVVFFLLLVIGYLAWVILMPHKAEKWAPVPFQPSPVKTGEPALPLRDLPKFDLYGNDLPFVPPPSTGRPPQQEKKSHSESENMVAPESKAIAGLRALPPYEASQPSPTTTPEPQLSLLAVPITDLPPPFSKTEIQAPPTEPTPEKNTLINRGEGDSVETSVSRKIEITLEKEANASASHGFSLQLGAFLKKKNAEDLISNLEKKGYKPYLFEKMGSKNRQFYAVRLSDHGSLEAAATATEFFRKKEKRSIIIAYKDSLEPVADGLKR